MKQVLEIPQKHCRVSVKYERVFIEIVHHPIGQLSQSIKVEESEFKEDVVVPKRKNSMPMRSSLDMKFNYVIRISK